MGALLIFTHLTTFEQPPLEESVEEFVITVGLYRWEECLSLSRGSTRLPGAPMEGRPYKFLRLEIDKSLADNAAQQLDAQS